MIRIFGTMTDPSGSPVPGAIIELRAISSTSEVLLGSTVTIKCDQQGAYSFQLAIGTYDAYAQNDRCGDMDYLGTARVSDNSVDGDLHSILVDGGINITPPMLDSALSAAQRAESAAALTAADRVSTGQNAESAKTDSAAAKTAKDEAVSAASTAVSARDSIVTDANDVRRLATQIADQAADVSSKHSDVATKAGQVSSQANIVSTKYSEVVAKAAQVSDDASATQSAKNISVAAADTATQKAASAATHDASAQGAATRAENAASAVVGAVLDGGECDLSTGVYPQPITVAGNKYSTIWYVAVAGSVSGVAFDVGDLLRYTTAKSGYYFRVDAKDDVYSVNGEKGEVTVTPEKIGAEKTGVAQTLVDQHAAKPGAHQISGIAGLQGALDVKAGIGSLGIRNRIINGAMNIAQRNIPVTVPAGSFAYTLDRFAVGSKGSTTTVSRGVLPSGTKIPAINTLRVQGVAGTSEVVIRQLIEALNVQDTPVGAKLTFSVAVVGSSDLPASLRIFTGAAKDDFSNPTVVETKAIAIPGAADASILFVTTTMTAAMRNGLGCDLVINSLGAGWVQTTAWQLEVGDAPTPLEFRPIGLELALCQRYCLAVHSLSRGSETVGIGAYCTGTSIVAQMATPVEMRATPSWSGGVLTCAGVSGAAPVTIIDKQGSSIILTAPQAGNRQGDSGYVISSGVSNGFRGFIAEL
ncbi:prophage tail fiber N-terminal domain-containing protein [Aeromonas veronii]|uniref:prophage tail fiber N-terminal domain-containing protein n=1 Tax=Aeromonas veronii TaxID=654 RepID=UPI001D08B759|nr:prophage tail fiber N-terminal domain-containing protein [Aeromonas veronii]